MHQALYRKWRPQTFEDVYGQEHITSVLRSEVLNGKLSHAYLFCGPRGTGKTTCAKIISRAANCEHPEGGDPCGKCRACLSIAEGTATDVIEMDAASNNGVEDIRNLRDSVIYTPADLKYRVYIIDEVHMLTVNAFNALLKTLEEPPAHVIFILATTELQKIPATVLSRCQRFDFRRVAPNAIIERMKVVCKGEKITADTASLELIAKLAQGSFRDALNMLEYCTEGGTDVNIKKSSALLGASPAELLADICKMIAENDVPSALDAINEIYLSSRDIAVFWRELISFCRDMMLFCATRGSFPCDSITSDASRNFNVPSLMRILEIFISAENDMLRYPQNAKLFAEMAIVRACDRKMNDDLSSLLSRLAAIEDRLASGVFTEATPHKKETVPEKVLKTNGDKEKTPEATEAANTEKTKQTESTYTEKPVLKALRQWADIIKKLDGDDPIAAAMLRDSNGYLRDGKIVVRTNNGFACSMFSTAQKKQMLCRCISLVLGKEYSENDIVIEKTEEIKADAPISEFTDNNTEDN